MKDDGFHIMLLESIVSLCERFLSGASTSGVYSIHENSPVRILPNPPFGIAGEV